MAIEPRPEVWRLKEAPHGGLDFAELARRGVSPDAIIDFSTNVNPFGPSPRVDEALKSAAIDRYPDRESLYLTRSIATRLDISPECVLPGNGSGELLWLIGMAFLRNGDSAAILSPAYGEYERIAKIMGARIISCRATADNRFQISTEAAQQVLERMCPRAFFLCHPNNPTGHYLPASQIRDWAENFSGTLFVVDEAYIEFTPQAESTIPFQLPNIVVLRSMTKAHALAGLRLGYAVAVPSVIDILRRIRAPWSVSAMAQAAAIAAIEDDGHLQRSLAELTDAKTQLIDALATWGWDLFPNDSPFFLMRVGNGSEIRRQLLNTGILVRDCASFGLPEFVRISTQRPEENARLIESLRHIERCNGE